MGTEAPNLNSSDTLTVGLPQEWELFKAKHRVFLQQFPRLKTALNIAYAVSLLDDPADLTIFTMGRVIGEDFREIILLAGNGYGFGCMKALRSLYERAVTLRHLHAHPNETGKFARYDFIHRGKAARRVLEDLSEFLDDDGRAKLEATVAEMAEYETEFMVSDCKTCKTQRLNHTWSLDIVSMAKQAPTLTRLVFHCYQEPLLFAHATPAALNAHLRKVGDDGLGFEFGPQRSEASEALNWAHLVLLDVLHVFHDRFKPVGLEEAIADAQRRLSRRSRTFRRQEARRSSSKMPKTGSRVSVDRGHHLDSLP